MSTCLRAMGIFAARNKESTMEGLAEALSAWSRSGAKRIFDCACVLLALPVVIPALATVGLAVRVTSRGPVFFLQRRVGREGRLFTILKFRTLQCGEEVGSATKQYTRIGRWLRRWKLDELPQLLNVLNGDMSLVGPRPKMREYQLGDPTCRPGITGAATIVFAREEELLERVWRLHSAEAYRTVVMPAKHWLDAQYMARATLLSDLRLIASSVLRRWDVDTLQAVVGPVDLDAESAGISAADVAHGDVAALQGPALPRMSYAATAEAASSL